ncbi:MAG: AAA family ATPase [Iamia sp.]
MRDDRTIKADGLGPADQRIQWFGEQFRAIRDRVEEAVKGKTHVVDLSLVCLVAEGHLLIEDVPGVGKTTLARALAAALNLEWTRVQFTPDLLPSDITGVSIFHQGRQEFEFRPGPAFTNILVADEINRASPKTQSALLEVMEERQITVDGTPRPTPRPFLVVATQNPIELEGTYRLPEAQLDRFLVRVGLGYPDAASEKGLYAAAGPERLTDTLRPVASAQVVEGLIGVAAEVTVPDAVLAYIHALVVATRDDERVRLGASPRAGIGLVRAAQARAAADGRRYVLAEDVVALAGPVLGHRLILEPDARVQGLDGADLVQAVIEATPAPVPAATP